MGAKRFLWISEADRGIEQTAEFLPHVEMADRGFVLAGNLIDLLDEFVGERPGRGKTVLAFWKALIAVTVALPSVPSKACGVRWPKLAKMNCTPMTRSRWVRRVTRI